MNTSSFHPFSHRYTNDCVESICKQCFFTVARVWRETELERFEREHVCDPVIMDCPSHQILCAQEPGFRVGSSQSGNAGIHLTQAASGNDRQA